MKYLAAAALSVALIAPTGFAQIATTPEQAFAEYKIACRAERDETAVIMHRSRGLPKKTLTQMTDEERRVAYVLTDSMFWNMLSYSRDSVIKGMRTDTDHSTATNCGYRERLAQIDRGGTQWPYPHAHGAVDEARQRYREGEGRGW